MVLISHKYKFIYIKNKKVAGSSVESFFGKYCQNPNKKYYYKDKCNEKIDEYGIIGRRLNGKGNKWVSHKSAEDIKKDLGEEKFNNYFKFCVIRNPYDKIVSKYFWSKSKLSFEQFVKKSKVSNLNIHSINNKSVCDYYIRFENLENDIENVCKILNIKNYDLELLPKHKTNSRPKNKNYKEYYNEDTKKIVFNKHKKEFELFNYDF